MEIYTKIRSTERVHANRASDVRVAAHWQGIEIDLPVKDYHINAATGQIDRGDKDDEPAPDTSSANASAACYPFIAAVFKNGF